MSRRWIKLQKALGENDHFKKETTPYSFQIEESGHTVFSTQVFRVKVEAAENRLNADALLGILRQRFLPCMRHVRRSRNLNPTKSRPSLKMLTLPPMSLTLLSACINCLLCKELGKFYGALSAPSYHRIHSFRFKDPSSAGRASITQHKLFQGNTSLQHGSGASKYYVQNSSNTSAFPFVNDQRLCLYQFLIN